MPPQRPSLRVPTVPLVTGFCESGLKYTFSCHGKLSTIVGTKIYANKNTVLTVASFYRLNSVRFWPKILFFTVYTVCEEYTSPILTDRTANSWSKCVVCSKSAVGLKTLTEGLSTFCTRIKQERAQKWILRAISTVKSQNASIYMVTEPKQWKMKKVKTVNRPDYSK